MKRFILASAVVLASVAYVLYQGLGGQAAASPTVAATPLPATTPSQPASTTPQMTPLPASNPTLNSTPAPAPAPAPAPTPKGQYADGTYIGSSANAYYGMVQVQAIVSGGKIADVTFLSYPSDRSTSRFINSQAMPYLTQEAIQAQNANVDVVSGATDTSLAFRQSLTSALAQAGG